MTHVCLMQYAGIFLASLLGGGAGSFIVVRFWRTGELNGNGRDLKQK